MLVYFAQWPPPGMRARKGRQNWLPVYLWMLVAVTSQRSVCDLLSALVTINLLTDLRGAWDFTSRVGVICNQLVSCLRMFSRSGSFPPATIVQHSSGHPSPKSCWKSSVVRLPEAINQTEPASPTIKKLELIALNPTLLFFFVSSLLNVNQIIESG